MKTNQAMKHDIEDILNSLDHIKKAEAPPYFYSQLLNRMEKEQPSVISRALQLLSRPVIGISVLMLFLVLNVVAIKGIMAIPKASQAGMSDAQSFAAEYNLNTTSGYGN
jgi:hypothetical protein